MNKLTNVPTTIEPIMAIDNGFCNSDPISEVNNNGTIAKILLTSCVKPEYLWLRLSILPVRDV